MVHIKWLRIVALVAVLTAGVWLFRQPAATRPEGAPRARALQSLAVGGVNGLKHAAASAASSGATTRYATVTPVVVDFSQARSGLDVQNSGYARWLRGELDLDDRESIVGQAQMAQMVAEALRQDPDPDMQIASSVYVEAGAPRPVAPAAGVSFDAIDFTDAGWVPPDPELAVGPEHLIVVVNVTVAIYDKSGDVVFGPTSAEDLFSQAPCTSGLFDPNVLYDEESERWMIAYAQGAYTTSGGYCVLASQSSDPIGPWNEYFFQFNSATVWLDFPHAGVGDNHIFMGANMFSLAGAFSEGRIFAFEKEALYDGEPVSAVARGLGASGSTPQPLRLHGYLSGSWPALGDLHYFLVDFYNGESFALRSWNPVSDSLALEGTVNLGAAGQPVNVPQNGSGLLMGNDWRPLDFEYRNGYGWTTMTISCNPGGGAVNCVRWAQIELDDGSLGPAGAGVYGSDDQYRFFPDLAVNHCDDMAVGYTRSNSSSFASIWVTGRESGDGSGMLQAEAELKAGEIAYSAYDGAPYRWGDYTGMTIDPDGETFWYLGQYAKDTSTSAGRWGTYVGSFAYPACDAPVATPAIAVTPRALHATQLPGTMLTETVTIENQGDLSLHWTAEEAPDDLPWASASPVGGTILAGGSDELDVVFDATGLARGVYSGTLTLLSNDPLTPSVPIALQLTVLGYGVATSGDQVAEGRLGQTVTYTVQITNTGDVGDTFDLSLGGSHWSAALEENSLALGAAASGAVEIYVEVPSAAASGEIDVTQLTVSSQGDAAQSAAVTLSTTALVTYGVQLGSDQATSALAGQTVTYTVPVTNTGDVTDTINLALTGYVWPTSLSHNSLTLAPGVQGAVGVAVQIPAYAGDGATDAVALLATSQGDASSTDNAQMTTTATLAPFYGVQLGADQMLPAAAGETVTYTVPITNLGDTSDTFTLSVSGASWVTVPSQSSISLNAGGAGSFVVTVVVPAAAQPGAEDVAIITATSQGDTGVADTLLLRTIVAEEPPPVAEWSVFLPAFERP